MSRDAGGGADPMGWTPRTARTARLGRGVAMLLAGAGILGATRWASHLTVGSPAAGSALRLALRAETTRLVVCRPPTAQELAQLPRHMQAPEVCDERPVTYRLRVVIDGETRADRLLRAAGLRADRPLVVQEQFPVAAGRRRVLVAFEPEVPEPGSVRNAAPDEGAMRKLSGGRLEESIEFPAGRVRLLTLAAAGGLAWREE